MKRLSTIIAGYFLIILPSIKSCGDYSTENQKKTDKELIQINYNSNIDSSRIKYNSNLDIPEIYIKRAEIDGTHVDTSVN